MSRGVGKVSDFIASQWLDLLRTSTTHLSLATANPFTATDPRSVEPSGSVYARAAVDWTLNGRLLYNANTLAWNGLTQNTVITYVTGWTAAFNGNLTFASPIAPLEYSAQQAGGLVIAINQFFVGLDA